MQQKNTLQTMGTITGHVCVVDDLGNVLIDQSNAIHPQNMARIMARALAHENNSFISRIAFGNGGTVVDAAFNVTYKTPNDGQPPDTATWNSRLYHETYSEIIDAGLTTLNPLLGTDPGSADIYTGTRPGGGANPANDPPTVLHVSGPGVRSSELGLSSQVVVTAVLNASEPTSQFLSDASAPTSLDNVSGSFIFDEIGLYTSGAQPAPVSGYQNIDIGNRLSTDPSGLVGGRTYTINALIDSTTGTPTPVTFTVPLAGGSGSGGQVLYGDLCEAINTGNPAWGLSGSAALPGSAKMLITDLSNGLFPSIAGSMTYGYLQIQSPTAGSSSSVNLNGTGTAAFVSSLNLPVGGTLETPVQGTNAGLQNAPTTPELECERLLAHLIFSPALKAANRSLTITYTLTVSFARTPS